MTTTRLLGKAAQTAANAATKSLVKHSQTKAITVGHALKLNHVSKPVTATVRNAQQTPLLLPAGKQPLLLASGLEKAAAPNTGRFTELQKIVSSGSKIGLAKAVVAKGILAGFAAVGAAAAKNPEVKQELKEKYGNSLVETAQSVEKYIEHLDDVFEKHFNGEEALSPPEFVGLEITKDSAKSVQSSLNSLVSALRLGTDTENDEGAKLASGTSKAVAAAVVKGDHKLAALKIFEKVAQKQGEGAIKGQAKEIKDHVKNAISNEGTESKKSTENKENIDPQTKTKETDLQTAAQDVAADSAFDVTSKAFATQLLTGSGSKVLKDFKEKPVEAFVENLIGKVIDVFGEKAAKENPELVESTTLAVGDTFLYTLGIGSGGERVLSTEPLRTTPAAETE